MDREDDINRKNLLDQDLTRLAGLCANIAHNPSADYKQSDMARALRVEWVRLGLDRSLNSDKTEAEKSLKKRMEEFLAEIPSRILSRA